MESGFYRVFPLLPRVTFAMVLAKCRTARFVTTPLNFSLDNLNKAPLLPFLNRLTIHKTIKNDGKVHQNGGRERAGSDCH